MTLEEFVRNLNGSGFKRYKNGDVEIFKEV